MGSRGGLGPAGVKLRLAIQGREGFSGLPTRATLRRWVTLALADTSRAEITLRFAGTREVRRINRVFRRKDYATNVLSFVYTPAPALAADIVLCMPVIDREAREQGKSRRAHLAHLVIHGVLHARGFDHLKPAEMRRMESLEIALLVSLRICNPYDTVNR